jgi:hypothetical protein
MMEEVALGTGRTPLLVTHAGELLQTGEKPTHPSLKLTQPAPATEVTLHPPTRGGRRAAEADEGGAPPTAAAAQRPMKARPAHSGER